MAWKFYLTFFVLLQALSTLAEQNKRVPSVNANHNLYEAVTGENADDDKSAWDNFYKTKKSAFGKDPIPFLKENLHLIPKGRAFVPAMGEGRNALFLAKKGYKVEGADLSEVAIQKANADARQLHLDVKTTVADLKQMKIPENYYDLIVVSLFYDKTLNSTFKKALKKGGFIVFYNRLNLQDTDHAGGARAPEDFLVESGEIKSAFSDFEIKIYREYKDQGVRVAALLAKKQ